MEHIDLTKCRGAYKCTINKIQRKKGGEYYIAELEFPDDKKITIDMQLIEILHHKLHKAESEGKRIEGPIEILSSLMDEMMIEAYASPLVRDEILKQII